MAIIDPEGLFGGERLSQCSDLAQLYWQRLYVAANSYGRLELSYGSIVSRVFRNFKTPPSEEQLWSVFEELAANYLAILYEVDGVWWAQFITNDKYLPRYKTVRDEQSPAPPEGLVEQKQKDYREWKKAKALRNPIFRKFSEDFGKFPKVSEGEERRGVGVGKGIGVGVGAGKERQGSSVEEVATLVDEIVCAHPRSQLRNLRRNEVRSIQQSAVLQAMRDEMKADGLTSVEALRLMLSRVQLLAEKVPRQEWRFFKDIPEFFRNHDYRMPSGHFSTGKERKGFRDTNSSNRAEAVVDSVLESTRAALARVSGVDHSETG